MWKGIESLDRIVKSKEKIIPKDTEPKNNTIIKKETEIVSKPKKIGYSPDCPIDLEYSSSSDVEEIKLDTHKSSIKNIFFPINKKPQKGIAVKQEKNSDSSISSDQETDTDIIFIQRENMSSPDIDSSEDSCSLINTDFDIIHKKGQNKDQSSQSNDFENKEASEQPQLNDMQSGQIGINDTVIINKVLQQANSQLQSIGIQMNDHELSSSNGRIIYINYINYISGSPKLPNQNDESIGINDGKHFITISNEANASGLELSKNIETIKKLSEINASTELEKEISDATMDKSTIEPQKQAEEKNTMKESTGEPKKQEEDEPIIDLTIETTSETEDIQMKESTVEPPKQIGEDVAINDSTIGLSKEAENVSMDESDIDAITKEAQSMQINPKEKDSNSTQSSDSESGNYKSGSSSVKQKGKTKKKKSEINNFGLVKSVPMATRKFCKDCKVDINVLNNIENRDLVIEIRPTTTSAEKLPSTAITKKKKNRKQPNINAGREYDVSNDNQQNFSEKHQEENTRKEYDNPTDKQQDSSEKHQEKDTKEEYEQSKDEQQNLPDENQGKDIRDERRHSKDERRHSKDERHDLPDGNQDGDSKEEEYEHPNDEQSDSSDENQEEESNEENDNPKIEQKKVRPIILAFSMNNGKRRKQSIANRSYMPSKRYLSHDNLASIPEQSLQAKEDVIVRKKSSFEQMNQFSSDEEVIEKVQTQHLQIVARKDDRNNETSKRGIIELDILKTAEPKPANVPAYRPKYIFQRPNKLSKRTLLKIKSIDTNDSDDADFTDNDDDNDEEFEPSNFDNAESRINIYRDREIRKINGKSTATVKIRGVTFVVPQYNPDLQEKIFDAYKFCPGLDLELVSQFIQSNFAHDIEIPQDFVKRLVYWNQTAIDKRTRSSKCFDESKEVLLNLFPNVAIQYIINSLHINSGLLYKTYRYILKNPPKVYESEPRFYIERMIVTDPLVSIGILNLRFISDPSLIYKNRINRYIPKGTASKQTFQCHCCFTAKSIKEAVSCSAGHMFCTECLFNYIESILAEGRHEIQCLEFGGCDAPIELEDIKDKIPEKTYNRLKQTKIINNAYQSNPNQVLVNCFHCGMPNAYDSKGFINCQYCNKNTCSLCRKDYHPGMSCENAENLNPKTKEAEQMDEAIIRSCSRCHQRFIKEEGCNRMVCPRCKTWTCYWCKKEIPKKVGYNHFWRGEGECPIDMCPLWVNNDQLHQIEAAKAQFDVQQLIDK